MYGCGLDQMHLFKTVFGSFTNFAVNSSQQMKHPTLSFFYI